MLTIQLANSAPRGEGDDGADFLLAVSSTPILQEQSNDYDYCRVECGEKEYAFADLSDSAGYKNDRGSWLFRKVTASDTIALELWKDCAKLADLNDNTYGSYYASFASEPLQTGYILEWQNVLSLHGGGMYQLKANRTLAGQSVPYESVVYRLLPYTDEAADGTVRLESLQNGNILGSQVNYRNLVSGGWPLQIRVLGQFGRMRPVLENSRYIDSNYRNRQIQDKIIREYTLETKPLLPSFKNRFILDGMLGNEIFATDYNLFNDDLYRSVPVVAEEPEVAYFAGSRRAVYRITFTHRDDLIRKRNF